MSTARIEELRKKFDENPRRYFAPLANEYRKAGDFDQAIFICQEYLPQQPGHMSGHIVFGQALFEAKRLPEAKSVFETALSLDPENLIALRHLADISRDLGDTGAARTWYERVLQADPRNDEVVAIMEKLGTQPASTAAAAAEAPTGEVPARAPAPEPSAPVARTLPDASSAPTVVLSAAAVQEMVRARQAAKNPPPPPPPAAPAPAGETLTLDESPTVEINAVNETAPMEGLEPTSQSGMMDLPPMEALGLETNAAPGTHAGEVPAPAPLDGLDTIPLDISLPDAPAPVAPTLEVPAIPSAPPAVDDGGLLDLDASFGLGSAPPAPAAAAPSPIETPIDGGHDSGELLDLDFPSPPETSPVPEPQVSVPTAIMDAIKSVVPAVQDAVESTVPVVMDAMESTAPAVMDFMETAIPSVMDAVQSAVPAVIETVVETPTVIMEAIKPPAPPEPPPVVEEPRISQSVPFVTETMAQLYLSQGHRAEAIDIYRKLIESRPNDAELKTRLASIEADERSVTTPMPASAETARPSAAIQARRFTGSGPSIRTVLRDLFGLDASATYAPAPAHLPVPGEVGSIDMLFSADPVAGELSPLALAFDGGYVAGQGTVDELFSGGSR